MRRNHLLDNRLLCRGLLGIVAGLALVWTQPAAASFHLWTIEEAFSNGDGTIQYIELHSSMDFQDLLSGHVLQSLQGSTLLHGFTFPANLPSNTTGNQFFLVATPAFAAVAGIQPDYVLPAARFIELGMTTNLTLFGALTPTFLFDPSTLPTDGSHSLTRVSGILQVTNATPTNFAGETGTMEPACSDGIDNDGDGFSDFPTDPGCLDATRATESPACQDGIDNDLDGKIDFDGGASANHGLALGPPDPQCGVPYRNRETTNPKACGLGAELALAMPLLAALGALRGGLRPRRRSELGLLRSAHRMD